jgi:ribosomal protein S27AE
VFEEKIVDDVNAAYSMDKKKVTTEKVGWKCPRCGVINSPETKRCACPKSENKSENGMVDINE